MFFAPITYQLGQIPVTPLPTDGGIISVLAWAVGILIVAVGSLFGLHLNSVKQLREEYDKRIRDRDLVIEKLQAQVTAIQREKDMLLHEMKPTLEAANSTAAAALELIKKMRNEREK